MEARREDTLDSVACDDGVEERPDSIVSGDYGFDMRSKVMRGARLDDIEIRVVRPVQQQAVVQDEVSQELVCWVGERRGIDDASVRASLDDESIHRFALCLTRSVRRAFGRKADTQTLRDSPDVEQHPTQEEELQALAEGTLAAPSLGHGASLRIMPRLPSIHESGRKDR